MSINFQFPISSRNNKFVQFGGGGGGRRGGGGGAIDGPLETWDVLYNFLKLVTDGPSDLPTDRHTLI